jgi:dTDP-4-amino-4,6-dideoxygalactose transaminase
MPRRNSTARLTRKNDIHGFVRDSVILRYHIDSMKVPLLDLRRQNQPIETEILAAFQRVLRSGHFILGNEVEQFERDAAALGGVRFGIGMSSGTDAILVALMALGIVPGDEVICPSFTFFATAGCIARLGAKPVFADSCASCFNIDPDGIEKLVTSRTRAIIPVHLFGQSADLDVILDIAKRHQLAVVEDAAQAFGAEYRGQPVCSFGDFATVSFFPSKNLGALGDAGLLLTNNAALAEKARLLRNHGMHPKYFHAMVGGNFRLDAIQAALLGVKLPHLAEYTAKRQRHMREYNRALELVQGREEVALILPPTHSDRTHIANQYTLRVQPGKRWKGTESPRDALRKRLQGRGIASEIYYPIPLHKQECFQNFGPHPQLPVAEALAADVISLPVFPELTLEEQATVIKAVTDFAG